MMTVKTLQFLRTDDKFHLFWQKCVLEANHLQVSKPTLPRRRNVPRRFDEGKVDNYVYPSTPEDHYRQIYFEAIDLIVNYELLLIGSINLNFIYISMWKVYSSKLQIVKNSNQS